MVLISASFTNIDYDPCNDYNILDNDWRSQVKLHRIYKLNAHERHHKVLLQVGNSKCSLSPEFPSWVVSVRKLVRCNGRSQRLKICSIGKDVEINTIIIIFCNVQ